MEGFILLKDTTLVEKSKKPIYLSILLGCSLLLLTSCGWFGSPDTPKAVIKIKDAKIPAGKVGNTWVAVAGGLSSGLGDLQVGPKGALGYNPSVVKIKNFQKENGFSILAKNIDNSQGKATFAVAMVANQKIKEGKVLKIKLEAVGTAGQETTLKITHLDVFRDKDGENISATISHGNVQLISPS